MRGRPRRSRAIPAHPSQARALHHGGARPLPAVRWRPAGGNWARRRVLRGFVCSRAGLQLIEKATGLLSHSKTVGARPPHPDDHPGRPQDREIPLAPRTARAIDLAIGERCEGPIQQWSMRVTCWPNTMKSAAPGRRTSTPSAGAAGTRSPVGDLLFSIREAQAARAALAELAGSPDPGGDAHYDRVVPGSRCRRRPPEFLTSPGASPETMDRNLAARCNNPARPGVWTYGITAGRRVGERESPAGMAG